MVHNIKCIQLGVHGYQFLQFKNMPTFTKKVGYLFLFIAIDNCYIV